MFSTNNKHASLKKWFSLALGASVVLVALFFGLWKTQVPNALALACEDPDAEGCGGGGGPTIHICSNGEDDDGDGKIDYATNGTGDPGCSALTDNNEHSTAQCDDGIDNDGDISVDYPTDTGCSSLTDTTELTPVRTLTVSIPVQESGYDNYARGTVSVSPGNNSCATGNCSFNYTDGQTVQLTATAQPTDAGGSSHFTGWSGDCSGTNATVSLSMTSNRSCTANFHRHTSPYPTSHTWTIRNVGNGTGTATYQTLGVPGTCTLTAGGSCVYTVQDDQYISQIRANPNANVTASYPNAGESCFQDGNVFVQHSRTCTVNFALNADPTCSATSPEVNINQTATFNAVGGTTPYSWTSTGGSPSSSSGSSQFVTSYATAGMKTATVTGGGTGTCTVNVVDPVAPPSSIQVRSNRNTTVQINGTTPQSNVALTANVTRTFSPSLPGTYSVTPGTLTGYTYVINPCGGTICSQDLSAGGTRLFDIVYTAIPIGARCSASPISVPRNTSTTFTAYDMTGPYTWTLPSAYYYFGPVITTGPSITAQYTVEGTYNATVTGGGKTATCPITVGTGTPPPPDPGFTMDFWVNSSQNNTPGSVPAPTTINAFYGSFARLEWASTGVSPTGCIASGSWTGAKATNKAYSSENQGPLTSPPTPKIYRLRCYGFATTYGGTEPYIEKEITINVSTTNKCTINVASNVASKWSITGPTPVPQAVASSTSGGPYIVDPGTYTIVPAAVGGGYTGPTVAPASSQSCAAGASINYALTYTPPPVATLDLKANGADNPAAIVKGTTAALTWTSSNIQNGSCTASGGTTGWAGPKTDTGSTTSAAINTNTTFTITCRRSLDGTNIVDSVTVPVREKQCGDGLDNDGDQRVDGDDPGCGGGDDDDDDDDDDEGNVWAQCADGIDNPDPEDALADSNDPGCLLNGVYVPTDNNEQNTSTVPIITACNDGFDNDGDGTIDAADTGCDGGDDTEQSEPDIREI